MMIKIEKIEQYYGGERGSSFFAKNEGRPLISILKRNKGTVSGHHYHTEKTKGKNPEVFVLISGKMELYVEDIKTKESQTHIIEENTLFEIPPYIYHEVKAITDFVALEFNVSMEDQTNVIEGKELQ
ncbi:hypothetical protein HOE37_01540 [Candidatus Woesearchaeota archaeon]|jgi:oxalate decarboxylase/phosphoglucose isomerase-like protein (cupin superfamily)|nr:hypothetical protein [Candidatus Woesearchaeota archaeon]MBT4110518.1 hypothetical protein [Candidatus Woesearchaeota archaeon]MBT4335958.1 hypothetical protein [Candidatus Woesearchaeota archaeon]MBT6744618.1 hypothetical protein [Candidatus Woesearchaeota archaeon]